MLQNQNFPGLCPRSRWISLQHSLRRGLVAPLPKNPLSAHQAWLVGVLQPTNPGLPRWAGTRKVKPIWILLKQETVTGNGISWATCKSAPRSRQITTPASYHSVFTGRMPFLPPNQQCQRTGGTNRCPSNTGEPIPEETLTHSHPWGRKKGFAQPTRSTLSQQTTNLDAVTNIMLLRCSWQASTANTVHTIINNPLQCTGNN